jgi:hypothetical protein
MTVTIRSVKGSNLTPTEVDNNFITVGQLVPTVEVVGRTLTQADAGGTIYYTAVGTATFTIPTGLTVGSAGGVSSWPPVRICRMTGAGVVTIDTQATITLDDVLDTGTRVLSAANEYVYIVAGTATNFRTI